MIPRFKQDDNVVSDKSIKNDFIDTLNGLYRICCTQAQHDVLNIIQKIKKESNKRKKIFNFNCFPWEARISDVKPRKGIFNFEYELSNPTSAAKELISSASLRLTAKPAYQKDKIIHEINLDLPSDEYATYYPETCKFCQDIDIKSVAGDTIQISGSNINLPYWPKTKTLEMKREIKCYPYKYVVWANDDPLDVYYIAVYTYPTENTINIIDDMSELHNLHISNWAWINKFELHGLISIYDIPSEYIKYFLDTPSRSAWDHIKLNGCLYRLKLNRTRYTPYGYLTYKFYPVNQQEFQRKHRNNFVNLYPTKHSFTEKFLEIISNIKKSQDPIDISKYDSCETKFIYWGNHSAMYIT